MSEYDSMSPRQFAAVVDKQKHADKMHIVDPDALAQKRFDDPHYEPNEAEKAYLQGVEHGSTSERETAEAEKAYRRVQRAPKEKTDDPAVVKAKLPAPRPPVAPKAPAQPKPRSPMADVRKMRSLAKRAGGRRR